MIGGLVGAGLSAVGSIFGGISASKAMKRVKKDLQQQKQENQNWYDRRYNEDFTQRADAQRILTKTEDDIRARNQQAAGAQAVMGGTEESTATTKAVNNQALAEAASQMAAGSEARKDRIEATYQQRDAQLSDALNNMEINKGQAISNTAQGVSQVGAGIAGAF